MQLTLADRWMEDHPMQADDFVLIGGRLVLPDRIATGLPPGKYLYHGHKADLAIWERPFSRLRQLVQVPG
jgi:hypothetical protein